MQLWAASVIFYFVSSWSCHLFTFLKTATPLNKWPVLLSHGQGCFLQLITSRNAIVRNAFRLFAKKTNISFLSENITFPWKVNCSVSYSGHVKFYDRSLHRSWWHTVVASNVSQSLQLHMTAGSDTEAASLFPLSHLTVGCIQGIGWRRICRGLKDSSRSIADLVMSPVCQHPRFKSQQSQAGEQAILDSMHHCAFKPTARNKARREAMDISNTHNTGFILLKTKSISATAY